MLAAPEEVPAFEVRWCKTGGEGEQGDFIFTGIGFTDGALHGGGPRAARRAGWAAVAIDGNGKVTGGCYGPCASIDSHHGRERHRIGAHGI